MLQSIRQTWRPQQLSRAVRTCNSASRGFHKNYDEAREEQSFRLADGRTVGFAEYGNTDGTPAFFLHGSPGCRYNGHDYIEIAKRLNMRIISPDRPGYGRSTVTESRKLSEYAGDIQQLARHLNIPKYHVFGISGGGPFAIACAYAIPKGEILTTAVIVGMGHPDVLTVKDDGWYTVIVLFLCKWVPGILRLIINWVKDDDKRLKDSLNKSFKTHFPSEEDQAILADPEFQATLVPIMKEVYAQGAEGSICDAQMYAGPWDFELRDVQNDVKLFFGLKDSVVPLVFGRHYEKHLPNAELIEYEDMSHVNTSKFDEEMLSRILGTWKPRPGPTGQA